MVGLEPAASLGRLVGGARLQAPRVDRGHPRLRRRVSGPWPKRSTNLARRRARRPRSGRKRLLILGWLVAAARAAADRRLAPSWELHPSSPTSCLASIQGPGVVNDGRDENRFWPVLPRRGGFAPRPQRGRRLPGASPSTAALRPELSPANLRTPQRWSGVRRCKSSAPSDFFVAVVFVRDTGAPRLRSSSRAHAGGTTRASSWTCCGSFPGQPTLEHPGPARVGQPGGAGQTTSTIALAWGV